jgi:RNA polymerase sigma-70 factor (ECF subfamily)
MSGADEKPSGGEPDERTVDQVLAGDTEAFATLVERYQRPVLALGIRFFRGREDAEDFVQEVFLQAFRKLHTFRRTGRFYSWLMRIAYNHGYRLVRRRPSYDSLGERELPDQDHTPHEAAERHDVRRAVLEAIRRLPARFADCIGLYFFFELSYQEVSDMTGYPLNTVRSHIRRAKLMLADRLRDEIAFPASPGESREV